MQYSTTALVLKTYKLGEADRILHLYSPEHGPIRAVAKSAAKASSGYSAKTQVLNYCDFQIAQGRNLDTLIQAKLIEDFRSLRGDYDAISLAYFMLEVLDHIAVQNDSYAKPFQLVYGHLLALNQLASSKGIATPAARARNDVASQLLSLSISFIWSMIDYLGYRPDLDTCSLTNRERRQEQIPQYFDFENGSVTSTQAYMKYMEANPYQDHIRAINPGVFRLLKLLELNSEFALWDLPSVSASTQTEPDQLDMLGVLALLKRHLSHHLEYDFKSWTNLEPILQVA